MPGVWDRDGWWKVRRGFCCWDGGNCRWCDAEAGRDMAVEALSWGANREEVREVVKQARMHWEMVAEYRGKCGKCGKVNEIRCTRCSRSAGVPLPERRVPYECAGCGGATILTCVSVEWTDRAGRVSRVCDERFCEVAISHG